MISLTTKRLVQILAALLVLVLAISGYGLYRLDAERKTLRKEVASLNNRTELLLKKYNEQKAMTDSMRRATQEIESRARDAAMSLANMEKEKKQLESAAADHEKKMTEMRNSYEEAIAGHKEHFDSLRTSYDNLKDESNRIIKEKNEQITLITNERASLDASLKQESFQNKRCREHNGRFAALTDELVKRYENKGVLSSVGQLEPFTQLKKVEIEKICQEYRDKIDENTLPKEPLAK